MSSPVVALLFSVALKHMGDAGAPHTRNLALPDVHRVSHAQLEAMACHSSCRVRAFYVPHLGVFLDDDLDVENDEFAKSVLLHELVHHVQASLGKYDNDIPCRARQRSEMEAYSIQNDYLMAVGSATQIVLSALRGLNCPREATIAAVLRPDSPGGAGE